MSNPNKDRFLSDLHSRFGKLRWLPDSRSLLEIEGGAARIYIRYSKVHSGNQTFYGLREKDLKLLEGHNSFICFISNAEHDPIVLDYERFEEIINEQLPASDGQYKVHIFHGPDQTELRLGKIGRFNVDGFFGLERLYGMLEASSHKDDVVLSHTQVQTLLGAIGSSKGYNIWIPQSDRRRLDWISSLPFIPINRLPDRYAPLFGIADEIDVMWLEHGGSNIAAMFEVEHSTPIYSGLLRFNDLHLTMRGSKTKYSITALGSRRSKFYRQIGRPTFVASGLADVCNFLDYRDVWAWHTRVTVR